MKTVVCIYFAMLCVSPFGLTHLVIKYGSNWKFKDLETKDKFVYFGLWVVIALWLGLLTGLIISII